MRLPLALLLALAVALAGCASEPDAAPTRPSSSAAGADAGADEGAAGEEGAEGEGEVDPAAEAPVPPVITFLNGTVTAVAAANEEPVGICCPTFVENGENIAGTFRSEKGAPKGIVVEIHWADTTFDLDLGVYAPDHEYLTVPEVNGTSVTGSRGHAWWAYGGQVGSPEGHVAILIDDLEVLALEGDWSYRVSTKTANNVGFTVAITLFYDEAPTADFTAFTA